ncbi:MAG TPA: pyridoxal phosphate-dependent aminotransferase family protein [Myxococcota bacterium]|nr:pyridoxal phosphate-dependent aminotransferase family protein [Myxococcota bacterium]
MTDLFDKVASYDRVQSLRDHAIYPYYRVVSSGQDPVVMMNGRPVVMLGSNNYLGLSSHPEVKAAAAAALEKYGTGCAGSRLLNGTLDIHVELEERLARFMRREAVITFATGYQANVGAISALLGRHDVVFLDNLDHASLIDGVRLGFAKDRKFKHNDMADLEKKLAVAPEDSGKLIVVDGVYSMEGDLADLPRVVELARRYGARVFVDEAHGVGVLGTYGRGACEHFGVESEVDLVMGTFSKSLASVGGFIAGSRRVIDYIKHNARSAIFSAAPAPPVIGAVQKALDILEREPERRKALWENTDYMKAALPALGFQIGKPESPVIPILVGQDEIAYEMAVRLQDEGVFANPVVSPAVQPGNAMIRTSYMATHTRAHLDVALEALASVGRQLGVIR